MGQLKKKTKSADTPSKKRKLDKPAADSPSKPDKSAKVLAEQSFEEFLQGWDNSDGGSGDDEAPKAIEKSAETKTKKKKIVKKKTKVYFHRNILLSLSILIPLKNKLHVISYLTYIEKNPII